MKTHCKWKHIRRKLWYRLNSGWISHNSNAGNCSAVCFNTWLFITRSTYSVYLVCYWLPVTNRSNGNLIRLNFISIFQVFDEWVRALIFPALIRFYWFLFFFFFWVSTSQHQPVQTLCRKKKISCYMTIIKIIIAHPRIRANYLIFDKPRWIKLKVCN